MSNRRMDITDALKDLGIDHNGNFHVEHKIMDVSGAELDSSLIPQATVLFKPALSEKYYILSNSY